jgi:hypothetical protein
MSRNTQHSKISTWRVVADGCYSCTCASLSQRDVALKMYIGLLWLKKMSRQTCGFLVQDFVFTNSWMLLPWIKCLLSTVMLYLLMKMKTVSMHAVKIWERGMILCPLLKRGNDIVPIINFCVRRSHWLVRAPISFTAGKGAPNIHGTGAWAVPRAGVGCLERRRIFCP